MAKSRSDISIVAAVLGIFLLAGVSAQDTTFPFCDCVRPKGVGTSPYNLAPTTTTTAADGSTTTCWGLTATNAATGKCNEFDLKKIELNINTECRGAVRRVTFDNVPMSASYSEYKEVDGMVFKITKGTRILANLTSLVGKTTPVCITFDAAKATCNNLRNFCRDGKCEYAFFSKDNKCCPGQAPPVSNPSPLSPPPPPLPKTSPFPFCACNQTSENSFSLSPSNSAPVPTVSAGRNTYCWTLEAERLAGANATCKNFDLKKIEFDINPGCQRSISGVTLDGETIAPSFSRYPKQGGLVWKVTRGTRNLKTLDSLVARPQRLCVTLAGSCPTLASLCTAPFCRVAYFSPNNKCCPLAALVSA